MDHILGDASRSNFDAIVDELYILGARLKEEHTRVVTELQCVNERLPREETGLQKQVVRRKSLHESSNPRRRIRTQKVPAPLGEDDVPPNKNEPPPLVLGTLQAEHEPMSPEKSPIRPLLALSGKSASFLNERVVKVTPSAVVGSKERKTLIDRVSCGEEFKSPRHRLLEGWKKDDAFVFRALSTSSTWYGVSPHDSLLSVCSSTIRDARCLLQRQTSHQNKSSSSDSLNVGRKVCKCLSTASAIAREPISPSSPKYVWWTVIGAALLSYDFVVIPLHEFLRKPVFMVDRVIDWIARIYWMCDILVSFRTCFWQEDQLIVDSKRIANQYLKTFFVFDLVILALEWVPQDAFEGATVSSALRVFRLFRFLRLLRVVKMKSKVQDLLSMYNSALVQMASRMTTLSLSIVGFNHLLACCWFGLGSYRSDGWVYACNAEHEKKAYQYLVSYKWALSNFHGTQTIASYTDLERLFSIVCLILGLIFTSTLISFLTMWFAEVSDLHREVIQRDRLVWTYVTEFRLPTEVYVRIKKSLLARAANKLTAADKILTQLPLSLLLDVHFEARVPMLSSHTLFRCFRSHFQRSFHQFCHDCVMDTWVPKNDRIFHVGDTCNRMLFFWSGRVSYDLLMGSLVDNPPELIPYKDRRAFNKNSDVRKQSFVCEPALWVPWVNLGTLRATESSTFLAIEVGSLEAHANAFADVHAALVLYARQFLIHLQSCDQTDLIESICFDLVTHAAAVDEPKSGAVCEFFLSHTQRDDAAKLIATELYSSLAEIGKSAWLDVKMDRCDRAAMECGVKNSEVFIAIVTDNGVDSYFSREMCREEIAWAISAGKRIVPVVAAADKRRVGDFIAEGRSYGIDFSELNFCQYDRSGPVYSKASVRAICAQADRDPDA